MTVQEVITYLWESMDELEKDRVDYDTSHPEGAETVEDKFSEGELSGRELELANLLTKLGEKPYG